MPVSPRRLAPLFAMILAAGALIPPPLAAADPAADVFNLINQQRALNGVPSLSRNSSLDQSAQSDAAQMASENFFGHYGLNGDSNPGDRMAAAGYTGASTWGENIAAGYPTAVDVVTGWMNSPGHRANILDPSFQNTGIGVAYGGAYGTYWVQDFGASSGSPPPPPAPTPTPTPTPSPTPTLTPTPTTATLPSPTGSIAGASMFFSAIDGAAYRFSQATIHVRQTVTLTLVLTYSSGATNDVSTDSNTTFVTDPAQGTFITQNDWSPTAAEVNHSITIYGIFTSPNGQWTIGTASVIVQP